MWNYFGDPKLINHLKQALNYGTDHVLHSNLWKVWIGWWLYQTLMELHENWPELVFHHNGEIGLCTFWIWRVWIVGIGDGTTLERHLTVSEFSFGLARNHSKWCPKIMKFGMGVVKHTFKHPQLVWRIGVWKLSKSGAQVKCRLDFEAPCSRGDA